MTIGYIQNSGIAFAAVGAITGAVIGSFIAVVVLRWGVNRSVVEGRSQCDGCGTPIAARDLVPVFAYAARRGRARCCGGRIDPLHVWAELAGGLIGLAACLVAPPQYALPGAIFGWTLLTLALLDLRHFWLPDRLTLPLAMCGVIAAFILAPSTLPDRLIGGVAGAASFAAIRFGYRAVQGREGLGGGDVKLFAAIGFWLGWAALPMVLLLASLSGLFVALGLAASGRAITRSSMLPFGVFLAGSAWIAWMAQAAALS